MEGLTDPEGTLSAFLQTLSIPQHQNPKNQSPQYNGWAAHCNLKKIVAVKALPQPGNVALSAF